MADELNDLQSALTSARQAGYTDDQLATFLSKHPTYGPRLQKAKESGYSTQDILKFLSTKSEAPTSLTSEGPFKAVRDVAEGAGAGIARSLTGLRDVAAMGAEKIGLPALPDVPEVFREAGKTPENASLLFKAAKAAETIGEFFIPGGAINRGVKGAEALMGIKGAETLAATAPTLMQRAGSVAARGVGEAAGAGSVALIQSGGEAESAAKAAMLAGGFSAGMGTIAQALQAVPAAKVYGSTVISSKIPERFRSTQRVDEIVEDAINQGITISKKGLERIGGKKQAAIQNVEGLISESAEELVDSDLVVKPLLNLRSILVRMGGKESSVKAIDRRIAALSKARGAQPAVPPRTITSPIVGPQGQPITTTLPEVPAVPTKITVREAQTLKKELGGFIRDSAYGKRGTGEAQRDKLVEAGYMQTLEAVIPELREANRVVQNRLLLERAIHKMVESSSSQVNEKSLVLMFFNWRLAASYITLSNPHVRSALAILINKLGHGTTGAIPGKLGGAAGSALPAMPQPPATKEEQP